MDSAKNEVKSMLKLLNDYLLTRTYLVGDSVTLADIAVCVALLPLYKHVLDASARDGYVNVTRYFNTLIHQKEFASVLGEVELCKTAGAAPKAEKAKPAAPKAKSPAPPPEADDAGDDLLPAQPKQKDPFEKFPKGNFNMDDFKRFYSNNPESKSIPYFWEKFDKENFSIWYCEYKYADELTMVFMSCNLISGMMQRLDKMRKNAFGSMLLFGEDNNSTISGIWVWRGHELAFTVSSNPLSHPKTKRQKNILSVERRLANRLRIVRVEKVGRRRSENQDHGERILCLGGQFWRQKVQPRQNLQVNSFQFNNKDFITNKSSREREFI